MNTTQKPASALKIGDVIRVSYINRNSKDPAERITVQLDANGFETTVTNFRARALVGKGVLIMVQQGVFGTVLPNTTATVVQS